MFGEKMRFGVDKAVVVDHWGEYETDECREVFGGYHVKVSVGYHSDVSVFHNSEVIAGGFCSVSAGRDCVVSGGEHCRLMGERDTKLQGGPNSVLIWALFDWSGHKIHVFYVGKDLEPDKMYTLEEAKGAKSGNDKN